jgi:hypothetical protein
MHNPPVTVRASIGLLAGAFALSASLAGCGGDVDDRPAKWSFISATIMEPTCATASCHSEIVQRAGVDLHDRDIGYRILTQRNFVRPGNADASTVITLMEGKGSIRMPPDFALPTADVELVKRWIAAGATNE